MAKRSPNPNYTREALIARLQALAKTLGRKRVTQREFDRNTRVPHYRIARTFGSYRAFVVEAGLAPSLNSRISDEKLLRPVRNGCLAVGGVIGRAEFRRHRKHGMGVYERRWGAWRNVLVALRKWVEEHDPDFAHLPALPRPNDDKPVPTVGHGAPPRYGAPMNFRGIANEPINEGGVIMLFGALAEDLGFSVERIAPSFPDCEAKRRITEGWRRVRIEFEYQSRNFQYHGHKPADCDLIVCWEHNWPEAPIEVLELKAEVAERAGV